MDPLYDRDHVLEVKKVRDIGSLFPSPAFFMGDAIR